MDTIIEFIKNNWKNILLVVLGIVVISLLMSTTCESRKNDVLETNIKALTDTIHTYQLKNGELMYEKQGYILEKEELEKYLDISKKEVKDLEKKLNSSLATIAKLKAQVHVDTIKMTDSIYVIDDSVYKNDFKYTDKWLTLNGNSVFSIEPFFSRTTINNISMDVPLKVGTTKDDQWFITTENPYVDFSSIEGANLVSPKKKNWSFSAQMGVGGLVGYGISGAQDGIVRTGWIVGAGFYAGVGFSYKIAEW